MYIAAAPKTKPLTDRALHIEELKQQFRNKQQFSIADILQFYSKFEKEVKRSSLDWRIHELKNRGILHRVGRGKYSLEQKNIYEPEIDKALKQLYNKIRSNFPFLAICIWNTKWLNEFMIHQPGKFYILIEVEKEGMEPVFYFLQEQLKKQVYLSPSQSFLEKYAGDKQETILVTHLISQSPVQDVNEVQTISLEKMLVDIFSDEDIFAAQQGAEMETIFRSAYKKYLVDEQKLLRYASRRGRKNKQDLEIFINQFKQRNQ